LHPLIYYERLSSLVDVGSPTVLNLKKDPILCTNTRKNSQGWRLGDIMKPKMMEVIVIEVDDEKKEEVFFPRG